MYPLYSYQGNCVLECPLGTSLFLEGRFCYDCLEYGLVFDLDLKTCVPKCAENQFVNPQTGYCE